MQLLLAARMKPFTNIQQLWHAGISIASLERLADADAFRSIGLDRRQALWEVSALRELPKGMFADIAEQPLQEGICLPQMTLAEHVLQDYSATTLSLKAHPVSFARQQLFKLNVLSASELSHHPDGTLFRIAGLVLVRQRPGTASGICFITLEDETGTSNLVVFQNRFDRFRKEILQSRLLMVEGILQREGSVIHVVVHHCYNLNSLLQDMAVPAADAKALQKEVKPENNSSKKAKPQKAIQAEIFYEGRNFR